ncbi:MAG TPA: hypothetical protein HPP83_01450 [Candidatus Hydrogenedentes bacterium]|nr:hypothetical protein [Candidatus Hydrogenedentota bacterium]
MKTDENGNPMWARTYGGSQADEARAVRETSDGGYILAGYTDSFGDPRDVYLVKTDADGGVLWSGTYGGEGVDVAVDVQETADGGYVLAGYTRSFGAVDFDMYVVKTDNQGNLEWSSTFGGTGWDEAVAIQETSDGGFIVVGEYDIPRSVTGYLCDVYLVKTDEQGNLVWEKTFEGSRYKRMCGVEETSDGGYFLAGTHGSPEGLTSVVYLLKTDADGNLDWEKALEDVQDPSIMMYAMCSTSDGGYVVVGSQLRHGPLWLWLPNFARDIVAAKITEDGDLVWRKTIGSRNADETASSVLQTDDGGYLLAGTVANVVPGFQGLYFPSDAYVVQLDSDGNPL